VAPAELLLTVEPNLRPREFPQDLRVDRRRFNGEPSQHTGDKVGSKIDVGSEHVSDPLGGLCV
jgi:hypothetical protein